MRSIIFAIVLAVSTLMATPASANDFINGVVEQGYTFNDGFWWQGDVAFVRQVKPFKFWDGCRWCVSNRVVFVRSHVREAVKQGPAYEGWRKDLLKMAESNLKWGFELKQSEQEQKEFLEAVKALNLDQGYYTNTQYPSNLTGNPYGQMQGSLYGQSSSYTAPLAQQGNTVFGYDSVASVYPDVDLKVLYNQANNLALGLQDLAGQTSGDFNALVSQTEGHRAEVARIIARGQAAAQVLQMLRDEPSTTTTHTEFMLKQDKDGWKVVPRQPDDPTGVDPGTYTEDPAVPQPNGPNVPHEEPTTGATDEDRQQLFAVIQNRCVKCHGPDKQEGKLDMTKFLAFSADEKREVIARLTSDDPSVRMPKAAGGGPGDSLPFSEVSLFFRMAGLTEE